jgi:hypothetical protein
VEQDLMRLGESGLKFTDGIRRRGWVFVLAVARIQVSTIRGEQADAARLVA